MIVFGTRPEAIKMAPLVHALQKKSKKFEVQVCVTAQHRQMLDQVLRIFKIIPDIDLNLMKQGQDIFDITSSILINMKNVFKEHNPDLVIVHGDTSTTLATAMASFYSGIPLGHVEAGLRTYNFSSPYPEEFNRQVVGKIARWHFSPTKLSQKNLLNEGVSKSAISITGNTVIDSLFWVLKRIDKDKTLQNDLNAQIRSIIPFDWQTKRFVLITGHRRENFGDGLLQICEAIRELASSYPSLYFVYPVHLNPKVINPVNKVLGGLSNVFLIKPMDYEPFVYLLKYSYLVLTDSGGIQEEAPSLGKPVIVMRDTTERPEAVDAGTVELVGTDKQKIISCVSNLLDDKSHYLKMSNAVNPYGDGLACQRIVNVLQTISL